MIETRRLRNVVFLSKQLYVNILMEQQVIHLVIQVTQEIHTQTTEL